MKPVHHLNPLGLNQTQIVHHENKIDRRKLHHKIKVDHVRLHDLHSLSHKLSGNHHAELKINYHSRVQKNQKTANKQLCSSLNNKVELKNLRIIRHYVLSSPNLPPLSQEQYTSREINLNIHCHPEFISGSPGDAEPAYGGSA